MAHSSFMGKGIDGLIFVGFHLPIIAISLIYFLYVDRGDDD